MSDDKNHVIIKDGVRASGLLTETEAKAKADKMRQLNEKQGGKPQESKIQVKQNLFG